MRLVFALAPALLAAACTTTPAEGPQTASGAPQPIEGEEIRYETERCYGTCPAYAVTVRPDGTGTFEGKNFTAVTGTRSFTITPDQYRAFAAKLAPYRPSEGERLYQPGTELCGQHATDMPGLDVRWSDLTGASQHLYYYLGCRPEGGEAMREALRSAPELLPIAELIGKR